MAGILGGQVALTAKTAEALGEDAVEAFGGWWSGQGRRYLWSVLRKGGADMLIDQIPLGSRYVWILGRIFSFLIIIPPLISASSGLLPVPVLAVVVVFWFLILLQMRGWSYGYASADGITFVSWVQQKHLPWDEVTGVNASSIGIRIQRGPRKSMLNSLLFNRWSMPLPPQRVDQRRSAVETLQRWWLDRSNNALSGRTS